MANSPQLWEKEYKQKGIPSSFRRKPSGVMNLLYEYLNKHQTSLKNKIAADLGAGLGRNSFSLVDHGIGKVYAIDFVPNLIKKINKKAKKLGIANKITSVSADLTKPWPMPDNSLDLIIDVFCFKHQANIKDQEFYKKEINRVLKTNGLLLISLAAVDDGYYGSLPKTKIKKDIYRINDPATSINSFLYTKESILREFGKDFTLQIFRKYGKFGFMHGKKYKRTTLWSIFKKN